MDSLAAEDEKKPFDAVLGQNEEETLPDPDEHLIYQDGPLGRIWLAKIPKFLLERWSRVDQANIHLATIRVYPEEVNPVTKKKPRIFLMLPPEDPENADHPDSYELDMVNDMVENQYVIAEKPKAAIYTPNGTPGSSYSMPHSQSQPSSRPGTPSSFRSPAATPLPTASPMLSSSQSSYSHVNSRARSTMLAGAVRHECNVRPMFTSSYRRRMKARSVAANTPLRQIRMIDDVISSTDGINKINMLSSGVQDSSAFRGFVKTKQKPPKGQFERMARMPRNQLLDMLFFLFRQQERWPIKILRERTQQPEVYLKEVLSEIAVLTRSGEFSGTWELKPNFREDGIKAEHVPLPPVPSASSTYGFDPKEEAEDLSMGEDEDEEDDMEEVS
ncbi:hypothetical protein PUNSTDRAFT_143873 [Punctularia strigosozonata HHB-11173 SS5]|uniref:uncharacterized protein n=1 Tax=Punctularia strigosozonata (strain HHB-11173) TaxID=741275 RepID=UPI0004418152|nr:uncharacterized protein PUNSTDRAFT_143873 [Punctularia strigosozonata HHB-11173 SS5]EIN08219.1 hypothetical protein PUNSTDRAFT_143873 [Punctularia strigosozonata HHB-11173 SS5]